MDRNIAIAYGVASFSLAVALVAVLGADAAEPETPAASPVTAPLDSPPLAAPPVAAPPAPEPEVVYVDEKGRPLREGAGRRHQEEDEEEEEEEEEDEDEDEDDEHEGRRRRHHDDD